MPRESTPAFSPGFRLSALDVAVLVIGGATAAGLAVVEPWIGFVIAFVVAHFFLFCNVIRMARPLELVWSVIFTLLAAGTIVAGTPGWLATTGLMLAVTAVVIGLELRKPSYHGLGWRRINPGLPEWWSARHAVE
uniref:Uncharacterized protein n=1 Tax=Schlesneria paludicola TaxID=360056 RepID=A0A7C2P1D8_9PLAN